MLALPFTFFVTIVLAAYTANLAAFLSRVTVDMPFRNVRECADKGCTFCTDNYALAKTQLDIHYPLLKRKDTSVRLAGLWADLGTDALPSCDTTYMFDTTLRMDASYAQGECDNVMVGGQLFSLPVAWPVRNEYAPSMNYWMKQLLDEGLWGELQEKYMPTATCDFYDVGDSEGDTGLSALKPQQFLGPIIIHHRAWHRCWHAPKISRCCDQTQAPQEGG